MPPYSFCIPKQNYSFAATSIALNLRGCHSLWPRFPACSARALDRTLHHISTPFARQDSVRPLRLSFVLLTASLSLSSPAGTKIFQFPAYVCIFAYARFGNPGFNARLAATPGLSQLATAFITAIAKPYSRWFVLANFSPRQSCKRTIPQAL